MGITPCVPLVVFPFPSSLTPEDMMDEEWRKLAGGVLTALMQAWAVVGIALTIAWLVS